ncbi:flagellar basal-body MS-ring/collar protein FliF [Pseudochelatococcus contaminans]|uniref:Flagellar M-ring protein n=1 Tax=Pseudochelatococcus contaminans TaxID=1538103 RepID=A0A7W5Z1L8_9HYPH|nr:flagellar basal-body MS-ring/collar protein FliF [Pseudochelatococcus contaminans]MBB3808362.1 flagellar M-ring protein FliF [Pseudochelatococcus contaminans]
MTGREQAEKLWDNIRDLGARRLAALAVVGLTVFLGVALGAYYLSRPEMEVLYTGLNRDDVARIGGALRDGNVPFDVSPDGTSVYVSHGNTANARMLLASKGLPQSTSSGYELFNELGSLGLTSFMQEVTRVRALEGEIARTIQSINGVKAARVHIVLPDRGSFRRDQQPPSASVVIRTEPADDTSSAQAIRQLVASAIPGMTVERVSVLNTDGVLIASGDSRTGAINGQANALEKAIARDLQENVRRSLAPFLGVSNFEVSIAVRLNTDKTSTQETTYDPESRVERSTRAVRESEASQNADQQQPTTVQQNIPQQAPNAAGSQSSTSEANRREEITNYEISTKTVQTVRDGYSVENMSVAVLINRARIAQLIGDNATPEAIDKQVAEIEALTRSAAGYAEDRGDTIKVLAVDFPEDGGALEPVPPLSITELLLRQMGNVINAVTILVVSLLLIWFGLRPAVNAILSRPGDEAAAETMLALEDNPGAEALLPDEQAAGAAGALPGSGGQAGAGEQALLEDFDINAPVTLQRRLEHVMSQDEERAAAILREWLKRESVAA